MSGAACTWSSGRRGRGVGWRGATRLCYKEARRAVCRIDDVVKITVIVDAVSPCARALPVGLRRHENLMNHAKITASVAAQTHGASVPSRSFYTRVEYVADATVPGSPQQQG